MFRSIRWRLVASYVLLAFIIIGSMGLLAQWAVSRYIQQQEIASLTANAESIARQAYPILTSRMGSDELDQLVRAAAIFGNVRVRILNSNHQLIADSGPPDNSTELMWFVLPGEPLGNIRDRLPQGWIVGLPHIRGTISLEELLPFFETLPHDTPLTVIQRSEGPWGYRLSIETTTWRENLPAIQNAPETEIRPRSQKVISVPIGAAHQPLGYVELSGGADFGLEALQTTQRSFFLAGAGAILLAVVFGLWMGNRISMPIRKLTETTREMSSGDLSVRASLIEKDEIGQLAAQFNTMAAQLQASFKQIASERDQLRRFITDASHELRTPITALKNFNELLLGAAAEDTQAREEFLRESQIQLDRLAWITQNLLDLSRLETGLIELDLQDCDAEALIEAAVSSFKTQIADKQLSLEIQLPRSPVVINCDQTRIELALANILENALHFTLPGGHIEIGALEQDEGPVLYVQDNGVGIHPDDLPHIFERFYRGRGSIVPGSGLGLSIVQSIILAHGGSINVKSEPGAGARFEITLPSKSN